MSHAVAAITPVPSVHPLRNRDFRLLWAGMAVSIFGDQFYFVALPWLVLQITGSGIALGTVLLTAAVPRAVFMLVGGVVSDKIPARRILLSTAICRMILVTGIAALVYLHAIHLWNLYLLALAFGIADAFAMPAGQVLIPSLVSQDQLPVANAVLGSTSQVCSIAGPGPAGIVLRLWGIATAFAIDAASFLFVILALWRLTDGTLVVPQKTKGLWRPIVDGLQFVMKNGQIRSLMLLVATLNLGVSGPLTIGIAVFAKQNFGSSASFGIMLSAMAAGTLLGSFLPAVFKYRQRRRGWFLLGFSGILGLEMISMGFLHHLVPVLTVLVTLGFGNGLAAIHVQSWFQANVDRNHLGRVMSVFMFAAFGLIPLSYAIAGAVAAASLRVMFFGTGLMILAVSCIAAFNKELRMID